MISTKVGNKKYNSKKTNNIPQNIKQVLKISHKMEWRTSKVT